MFHTAGQVALCTVFLCFSFMSVVAIAAPLPAQKPIAKVAPNIKPARIPVPNDDAETQYKKKRTKQPAEKPTAVSRIKKFLDVDPNSSSALSEKDIARYKKIFALQKSGDMDGADKVIKRLSNNVLMGFVLYERYLHPSAYVTSFEELKRWMLNYGSYPGAKSIYKLAKTKDASRIGEVQKPRDKIALRMIEEPTVVYGKKYTSSKAKTAEAKSLEREINKLLKDNRPTQALKLLNKDPRKNQLDTVQQDQLRGKIAARYFYGGHYRQAYEASTKAVARSKGQVPRAAWIAGLTSWRKNGFKSASQFFSLAATSPYSSGWMRAAGSYWTARAYMRLGNSKKVSAWLEKAYAHPRTFYGMLATRALGRDFNFEWDIPAFTQDHYNLIDQTKEGRRAIALVSVDKNNLADRQLLRLDPKKNKALRRAMLAYAEYAELPSIALRLGARMKHDNGALYDAAFYPVGGWIDYSEYTIDPALVHAIMRQESRFDAEAQSYLGASGLMQIMPATASYVAGNSFYKTKAGKAALLDPKTNIDLGQRYIQRMLNHPGVKGDLVSMLVAYNAGPGNLKRWRRDMSGGDDPLLFIESLPAAETRSYVERVLSNYWMYRLRANSFAKSDAKIRSMEMLVQGHWPAYLVDQDDKYRFASANN